MLRRVLLVFAAGCGVLFILLLAVTRLMFQSDAACNALSRLPSSLDAIDLLYEDLPLGDTELLVELSAEILQLDDFLFRQYTLPNGQSFNLFIAYWQPGKASQRLAAQHNPDVCWVISGGWHEISRLESTYLSVQSSENHLRAFAIDRSPISDPISHIRSPNPPISAQSNTASSETPNRSELVHTYFWQILEAQLTPIERVGPGSYLNYLRTIPNRIRAKRHPMWFIRIHSKTPLARVSEAITPGPLAPILSEDEPGSAEGMRAEHEGQGTELESLYLKTTQGSALSPSPSTHLPTPTAYLPTPTAYRRYTVSDRPPRSPRPPPRHPQAHHG